MQIDLRDIDYFLACAMHGRVTLAAEALDVGSPVVIEAIRRLEEEFNIELLTPACRHSSLTPWALNFADAVRGLSAGYADAVRVISEMKSQKTSVLRIGFPDPGAHARWHCRCRRCCANNRDCARRQRAQARMSANERKWCSALGPLQPCREEEALARVRGH